MSCLGLSVKLINANVSIYSAIGSGPWSWQSSQFYSEKISGYNPYYRFCDYVENVWPNSTNKVPGPQGVGIKRALDGYAKWFVEESLPGTCESSGYAGFEGEDNVLCFQNQNASNPIFHDLSVGNAYNRQWNWFLCNEPYVFSPSPFQFHYTDMHATASNGGKTAPPSAAPPSSPASSTPTTGASSARSGSPPRRAPAPHTASSRASAPRTSTSTRAAGITPTARA